MTQEDFSLNQPPPLNSAISDVTTLIVSCRRLSWVQQGAIVATHPKLRGQLRKEIQRGVLAYIDALTKVRTAPIDKSLLCECRIAAERVMPLALVHQADLCKLMLQGSGESGALVAMRQDLKRLLHLFYCLRAGVAVARQMSIGEIAPADAMITRLHRRLRRALLAYVRNVIRKKTDENRQVRKARIDALDQIGPRGATQSERLADLEAGVDASLSQLRLGVAKPLLDMAVDWKRPHVAAQERLPMGLISGPLP